MKPISTLINTHDTTPALTNPYLAQARERERCRFDFSIEMDLIGAEFRRLRKEKGLSIEAVAKALRMRKYRLCLIEHGLYIHLDVPQLRGLSAHYGVSHLDILSVIPDAMFENIDH